MNARTIIRETDKFQLYVASNLHAFLTCKVKGCRPRTVSVRKRGGAITYLRSLNDQEFNGTAVLEYGCGLYEA